MPRCVVQAVGRSLYTASKYDYIIQRL